MALALNRLVLIMAKRPLAANGRLGSKRVANAPIRPYRSTSVLRRSDQSIVCIGIARFYLHHVLLFEDGWVPITVEIGFSPQLV
jgi:hypothetical protein